MFKLRRLFNIKSTGIQVLKVGGGFYAYTLINNNIEVKWQRWTLYTIMAAMGLWVPLGAAAMKALIPETTDQI